MLLYISLAGKTYQCFVAQIFAPTLPSMEYLWQGNSLKPALRSYIRRYLHIYKITDKKKCDKSFIKIKMSLRVKVLYWFYIFT